MSRALNRQAEADRRSRDFTVNSLRHALVEVISCFPVYRTYITERGASAEDLAVLDTAIGDARRRNPLQEPSVFEFIRASIVPPAEPGSVQADAVRDRTVAFAQKFQQYTAPVVAKGLEDTAFYRDVLLLSANEVGGDLGTGRERWRNFTPRTTSAVTVALRDDRGLHPRHQTRRRRTRADSSRRRDARRMAMARPSRGPRSTTMLARPVRGRRRPIGSTNGCFIKR